ncbi:serine/threonine protein kinase [Minicystis rosea]|nr:serine/threonine protein kinase [Minicystis rosea]
MLPDFSPPSDRFTLEARVGSGGMGDIFRGIDSETGQPVAVKLLRATASAHERARFAREIAILADLRHPNIVQYVGHGTWHDGRLFFAMEWLEGEDLGQRQRRAPLGMRDAVEIVRRSAAAMAAVHARGVVHRDLKLSNIFLVHGKGTAIKLIDFGVVKPSEPDEFPTERGQIIGTPHFMAPEQARDEAIDPRADVYSLGAVLFRLVTGRNVFETEHVIALLSRLVIEEPPVASSIRFDVPEALDQVISRAIAKNRNVRYENGGELARALARVGTLNNDPPATDKSASAVRPVVPEIGPPSSGAEPGHPNPSRPGTSERRVVAVVLCDLAGSQLTPEVDAAVREVLGEDTRFEALAGGRVVAVLGVERSKGDEAVRAARAALTVARALQTQHAGSGVPVSLPRVAVAVGHAVRGRANIAGEALDRAARQLDRAAPGTVRIDGYAAISIEGRFVVQEDPEGGVLVREDASGFGARQLLGRATPTVGREKEIALLVGIYSELCEDGTPRAALVTGPAGIGKSRVRAEMMQRLETAAWRPEVLLCRGDAMSRGGSISALGRALRALMGVHDGEQPHEQVTKVKNHVAVRLPRTLRFLAAFLGELIGVPFPDDSDEPLRAARASAQLMQSRMRTALEAFVRVQPTPLVLFIEDMHWADDTTIDLVDWLLGCPDLRFGVFAFARPEIQTRLPQLWERRNVTRLTLSPLSPLAAERLVAAALPSAEPTIRASIVRRAGGNALFLEELIRYAAEGREELPLTVQAVVQARLDRMSPQLRQVLRAASVFGQSFWTGGVEALLDRPAGMDLSELQHAEIITRQPESRIAGHDEWIFRQALVRDAAYASVLEEDRAALHLDAGAWLESVGDVDVGLIARHADAGGDLPRAAVLYARATRQAYSNGAQLETALELADRGLACGAEGPIRAQLLIAKAQVSAFMGRLRDAIAAGEEATTLAPAGSDMWAEAQRVVSTACIESGRAADGDARAAWVLANFPALSPSLLAALQAARVRGLIDLGVPAQALAIANQAVETARASGAIEAMLRALDARLFALMHANDASGASVAGAMLIEAAENAGDVVLATRGRINTGSVQNHLGLFEDAQANLERSLHDARARRMRILEAFSLHNVGMSYARLGNLDEGISCQRHAARIADETSAARLRIHARCYEAIFLVWRGAPGDLGAAHTLARFVCDETRSVPALYTTAIFVLAKVQLARRYVESALELSRDVVQRLTALPVEEWEESMRLTLVESLLAFGHEQEADMVLDAAFQSVVAHAGAIAGTEHRRAYLTRIEEVRRIVEMARDRLGRMLPDFPRGRA